MNWLLIYCLIGTFCAVLGSLITDAKRRPSFWVLFAAGWPALIYFWCVVVIASIRGKR